MPTVADVLRRFSPGYLERFGDRVPAEHKKVFDHLTACRTGELGTIVYACSACGQRHALGRSCGNRHCPTCQRDKAKAWLENQRARLLPCPYFLLTFTLPAQLRRFVRSHQRLAYSALFEASSQAIKRLAADPKFIGTPAPGFVGVLHTWGRTLDYHPHVHYLVPGGGPNEDESEWLPSRADFFLPVRALSKIYRAKFRDAMQRAGLLEHIDPAVWKQDWVVHSKPVGDGRASLKYLAPYVFRVAISNARILSLDDNHVRFSYRKSGSMRWRTMTLEPHEFLRRFLQHVLPAGFQKVRYYGFASANAKLSADALRWLISLGRDETFFLRAGETPATTNQPSGPQCSQCGGTLYVLAFVPFAGRAVFDTS